MLLVSARKTEILEREFCNFFYIPENEPKLSKSRFRYLCCFVNNLYWKLNFWYLLFRNNFFVIGELQISKDSQIVHIWLHFRWEGLLSFILKPSSSLISEDFSIFAIFILVCFQAWHNLNMYRQSPIWFVKLNQH